MKKVDRSELLDYVTYAEQRDRIRASALAAKENRRVTVAEHFTFLFENSETVRYQVQEMMRTEQIVKEDHILHELHTYNELLGDAGELGCTLLIGLDDEATRSVKLRQWLGLNGTLYLEVEGGERVRATWDPRQVGDERLSAVQYLKFDLRGRIPVAMGIEHPAVNGRTELTAPQREALAADLH